MATSSLLAVQRSHEHLKPHRWRDFSRSMKVWPAVRSARSPLSASVPCGRTEVFVALQLIVISSPGSIFRAAPTLTAKLRGMNLGYALQTVSRSHPLVLSYCVKLTSVYRRGSFSNINHPIISISSLWTDYCRRLTETSGNSAICGAPATSVWNAFVRRTSSIISPAIGLFRPRVSTLVGSASWSAAL